MSSYADTLIAINVYNTDTKTSITRTMTRREYLKEYASEEYYIHEEDED